MNCNGPTYTSSDGFYTTTEFTCPPESELWNENKCNEPKPIIPDENTCGSAGNSRIGNPCNAATGEKVESEIDYRGPTLNFTRTYRSMQRMPASAVMAPGWHHNYSASLILSNETGLPEFSVRPDGGFVSFSRQNDDLFYSTHNTSLVLRRITDEWELQLPGNAREYFSLTGKLLRIVDTQNNITRLQYDENERLSSVTGVFGRVLQIAYDVSGQIETVLDPAGERIGYEYDERRRLIQVTYQDAALRTYHYENADYINNLTGITDENGRRYSTFAYDSQGRVTLSTHSNNADRTDLTYNTDGTTTVLDVTGETRVYNFQQVGDRKVLTGIDGGACINCESKEASYSRDANGFITDKTDLNGNIARYNRDTRGRVVSKTEASGNLEERESTTQWHSTFNAALTVTTPGKVTTFTYWPNGLLQALTELDSSTSVSRTSYFGYTEDNLIASIDGPRTDVSDITLFDYDTQGNLLSTTNSLGHQIQITDYDPHGKPLQYIDANEVVTDFSYDLRGRLLTATTTGATTTYIYDAVGNVKSITEPNGNMLTYQYDDAYRLIGITDLKGNSISYTLDTAGNQTLERIYDNSSTLRRTLSRIYNNLGRLVTQTHVDRHTNISYDAFGNVAEITDPKANSTQYAFDGLHRLIQITDANNSLIDYQYDAQDNLTQVTDPKGLATTYLYDGFGNLVQRASPDTGLSDYTYDTANNRLSQTDGEAITATYTYDALNRLTSITYPDSALNIDYSYDVGAYGKGRLTGISDGSGTTSLAYDHRGNLITHTSTVGMTSHTLTYSYNLANQLTQVIYPSGRSVDYGYDVVGLLNQIDTTFDGDSQSLAANLDYLPFGPLTQLDYGNGIQLSANYDADYRLSLLDHGAIKQTDYRYDAADNITGIDDNSNNSADQSFDYDALNRLTNASGAYGNLTYTYDENGNRLTFTDSTGTDSYTYDATSHRLLSTNNWHYQYDANGNRISKLDSNGSGLTYTYDDRNRMSEVANAPAGNVLASYTYNAYGQRITKTTPTNTTHYV
ncbi:MAG: hypothetical protein KUG81_09135, partial [Gammaproteobacteria bacterium]|nr:hypothetical protein [Gammaproteobacteria bacterium]